MQHLVTIESDPLPGNAHVVSARGTETISLPYSFQLGLLVPAPGLNMDEAIRGRATLSINTGADAPPQVIHGILASIDLLHAWGDRTLYQANLVPELWNLSQTLHSRVYTDNNIIEIIEAVLQHNDFGPDDYTLQLRGSYPKLEHVCQYRESDLAFISRWMEREGLYYFFEHGSSRERMVIADHRAFHQSLRQVPLRYVPGPAGTAMGGQAVQSLQCRRRALASSVRYDDYDYLNPTLALTASVPITPNGVGEVRQYGKNFLTPDAGQRLAEVRAEAFRAAQTIYHATGRAFNLRAGYTFALDEHPHGALNTEYLVVELDHEINQAASDEALQQLLGLEQNAEGSGDYTVAITAIPATVQYRPPEYHPWPRVDGTEVAVICGETDSEYAQLDDHGRNKARILFDESDLADGSATTWIRRLQPLAGQTEGFHFPLRKGTEVVLLFLGGDPDRPVIAGVMPNAHTPSPVSSTNCTMNVIQTAGLNRIEMNDAAGAQHVRVSSPTHNSWLHLGCPNAEYSCHLETDENAILSFGHDCDFFVGHDLVQTTEGDREHKVARDETISVLGMRSDHVQRDLTETFEANHVVTVHGAKDSRVGGTLDQTVEGKANIEFASDVSDNYGGAFDSTVTGLRTITIENHLNETVEGDVAQTYQSNQTTDVVGNVDITVGGNYTVTAIGPAKITGAKEDKFWIGDQTKVVGGRTSELLVGIKNDNLIGGKIETLIGVKYVTELAAQVDVIASHTVVEGVSTATIGTELASIASIIKNGGIDIDLTGLKIL